MRRYCCFSDDATRCNRAAAGAERQRIDYGNGTFTEYDYDDLRRMGELKHTFSTHDILKQYAYDKVSNVIKIATDPFAKRKLLDYDANGNLLLVEQEIGMEHLYKKTPIEKPGFASVLFFLI